MSSSNAYITAVKKLLKGKSVDFQKSYLRGALQVGGKEANTKALKKLLREMK